jgi:hypothetical protein
MPKAARIIPEYSLSTTAVYTQYTTSIITIAKNLDILTLREGIKTDLSLPSWVPDLRSRQIASPIQTNVTAYHATLFAESETTISPDCEFLTCKGLKIDHVDGLGAVHPRSQAYARKFTASPMGIIQPSSDRKPVIVKPRGENLITPVIWEVLCAIGDVGALAIYCDEFLQRTYGKDCPTGDGIDAWAWEFIDASADLMVYGKPLRHYCEGNLPEALLHESAIMKGFAWLVGDEARKEARLTSSLQRLVYVTRNRRLVITGKDTY